MTRLRNAWTFQRVARAGRPCIGVLCRSLVALSVVLGLVLGACGTDPPGTPEPGPSARAQWDRAQDLWRRRHPDAYAAWRAIDPSTPQARAARARLADADRWYREGIRRVEAGEPDATAAIREGSRIAPMDPELYLPLARACRDRGAVLRAAEFYKKFMLAAPTSREWPSARRELVELDPDAELGSALEAGPVASTASTFVAPPPSPTPIAALVLAGLAVGLGLGAVFALVRAAALRRGVSLAELARRSPELHPAIAYMVGSLRHELLKHRIGAVGDAVGALAAGRASHAELDFVRARLYGGEPLRAAWRGHLRAFERALGPSLDLERRDPRFRAAGRAIAKIEALEAHVERAPRARAKLARAHAEVRELDSYLAGLVRTLVRTQVDRALLDEVVSAVRSEYSPGQVELDELSVADPPEGVEIEVFRVDIVLVLKNVLRNAILSVGQSASPRRVALDVQVSVEPTGEELVRIRVRDTSDERLTTEAIYQRGVDRGLGLVTAALRRYDGAIEVEPGSDGWAKTVVVRLFRALD